MFAPRDKRTIYLHEIGMYEIFVPLTFRLIGVPPVLFFLLQGFGHILAGVVANKFYWWYGKPATVGLSRTLMIVIGCLWISIGYLIRK